MLSRKAHLHLPHAPGLALPQHHPRRISATLQEGPEASVSHSTQVSKYIYLPGKDIPGWALQLRVFNISGFVIISQYCERVALTMSGSITRYAVVRLLDIAYTLQVFAPVQLVYNYFGSQPAYYFAWLNHYCMVCDSLARQPCWCYA